jgi:hypothetical protein
VTLPQMIVLDHNHIVNALTLPDSIMRLKSSRYEFASSFAASPPLLCDMSCLILLLLTKEAKSYEGKIYAI